MKFMGIVSHVHFSISMKLYLKSAVEQARAIVWLLFVSQIHLRGSSRDLTKPGMNVPLYF